jgi:type II secretory pathway component GspD/PulD (secretin)
MKKAVFALFVFLVVVQAGAQALADAIKLDNAPLSNVVRLYFSEINQQAYSLPDELIKDSRLISLSIKGTPGQLKDNLSAILRGYGYELVTIGGIVTVRAVPDLKKTQDQETEVLLYRPRSRTAQYLVDVLRTLYPGITQAAAGLAQSAPVTGDYAPTSASAMLENKTDRILFKASPAEVKALRRHLALLDVPAPSVELQLYLIEYKRTAGDKTGFSALVNTLGNFSISMGSTVPGGDVLRFSTGAVQLALSALKTDNAFKVYTSPRLLLTDRKKSRLVVGQDVPVLTSTTSNEQGITQSIEYRSSGVIMEAVASILEESIEVDTSIEVSSFAETTTGVNTSPTLTKRHLQTSTVLSDGSAVLFGGLNAANTSEGSSGLRFLPDLLRSRSSSEDESELFVLMSATRI